MFIFDRDVHHAGSEIGQLWGRRTFLITSLRPVPPGTEGAVSLEGTLGGLLGGAAVAAVGALAGLYVWRWVPTIAIAGLLGSLAESVIGTEAEKRRLDVAQALARLRGRVAFTD